MLCANNRVYYGLMVVLICLHIIHYLIIISMQTYLKVLKFWNACQVHSVKCVSKIESILSVIFHAIYRSICIQLTLLFHDDYENTCNLSYYHHQIGSMTHLPLFRVRSWNNGMHCLSFYILIIFLLQHLCNHTKSSICMFPFMQIYWWKILI